MIPLIDLLETKIDEATDWWKTKSHCCGEMRELGVPDDADAPVQFSMGELRAILATLRRLEEAQKGMPEEPVVFDCEFGIDCLHVRKSDYDKLRARLSREVVDSEWESVGIGNTWSEYRHIPCGKSIIVEMEDSTEEAKRLHKCKCRKGKV